MNAQVGLPAAAGRFRRRLNSTAGRVGLALSALSVTVLGYLMVHGSLLAWIDGHHAFLDNVVTGCQAADCRLAALDRLAFQILTGAVLVALCVWVYARKWPVPAIATALTTLLLVLGKVAPSWDPRSAGLAYAHYAQHLSLDTRLVDYDLVGHRWLAPWLAHALGFGTRAGWLIFLLVAFLAGIIRLYGAIMKRTDDRAWACLCALVPAVTTVGWYSVYLPGYPDWALFAFVIFAVFAATVPEALIWATLALWTHERSLACLVVLPLLRLALFPESRKRNTIILAAGLAASILIYFLARSALGPLRGPSLSFYWQELHRPSVYGHSVPLSLGFVLKCAVEAFKGFAVLLLPLLALASAKLWRQERAAKLAAPALILGVVLVLAQVVVAVDTVRLMDLLIVPLLAAAALAYPQKPRQRRIFLLTGLLAVAFNLLSPITYLSQNWNFSVATHSAELPLVPWARSYPRSLSASEGPPPGRPLTLQWRTPASTHRQFIEIEKHHTAPPSRMTTEVPGPTGSSSTFTLQLPPGPHYQWRVISVSRGVRHATDWSQLYRRE